MPGDSARISSAFCLLLIIAYWSCPSAAREKKPANADDLLVVNCLLPGQVRQLGRRATYVSPRVPQRTTALQCRVRGGEYPTKEKASLGAAIKVWMRSAQGGDPEAQTTLGEIYEQGLGARSDYNAAQHWYRAAAEQGFARAKVNLGYLYERGLGVEQDMKRAAELYRAAAGVESAIQLEPVTKTELVKPVAVPALSASSPAPVAAPVEVAGPEISVIDPVVGDLTRGLVKTIVKDSINSQRIVGRVSAPGGLYALSINGQAVEVTDAGLFQTSVAVGHDNPGDILISAVDEQGKTSSLRVSQILQSSKPVVSERTPIEPLSLRKEFGAYHALLIANNSYQHLPDLKTPVADIERIDGALKNRYGFETTVLIDASRYQILSALNEMREKLTSDDNLLIYYAGHGELESANMRGHWLPVDAEPTNTANWLSNVDITDILNVLKARQVMLVADSCYSGTLTRSSLARLQTGMTEAERITWLTLMAGKRSRVVLSSGGVAPVLDLGGGKHSVFARAFAETLEANKEVLPGRALHQAIVARVAYAAAAFDFEQIPEYAPISRAGHEAGDFFLFASE